MGVCLQIVKNLFFQYIIESTMAQIAMTMIAIAEISINLLLLIFFSFYHRLTSVLLFPSTQRMEVTPPCNRRYALS